MTTTGRPGTPEAVELLALDGVLTVDQVAATARGIAAVQHPDGAIPWFRGHHLDPWDHVEAAMALDAAGWHTEAARAYRWLLARQNPDGSWHAGYRAALPGGPVREVSDPIKDANFCAYLAVGLWHHHLAAGDEGFLAAAWPALRAAVDFVLDLQLPQGPIAWKRDPDGTAPAAALLTGSSSIHHALRCALAVAERLGGRPQPDWELATGRLGRAVRRGGPPFLDKSRYSMDWYYPVLGQAVTGQAARARLAAGWDRFVVDGLGVRCVDDHPWVTGGESAELALALWSVGERERAAGVLEWVQRLRDEPSGMYWTGYVYPDDAFWPEERTAWTAGAVLLAAAALGGEPATVAVFGGADLPAGLSDAGS